MILQVGHESSRLSQLLPNLLQAANLFDNWDIASLVEQSSDTMETSWCFEKPTNSTVGPTVTFRRARAILLLKTWQQKLCASSSYQTHLFCVKFGLCTKASLGEIIFWFFFRVIFSVQDPLLKHVYVASM